MNLNLLYLAVLVFILAVLVEGLLLYLILPLLVRNGAIAENFRGNLIPVATGISFPITVLVCLIVVQLVGYTGKTSLNLYLIAIFGMAFLGIIDDMLGKRDTLGFRGHFSYLLLKRELTTGGFKALGGGLIACYVAAFGSKGVAEFIVNLLVIALFTNSMNLFDLRPGRCVKAFLLAFVPLFLFAQNDQLLFLPILGTVLVYFPYDLRGRVMMGDAGSNVLGVTLGVMAVFGLDFPVRVGILVLLILLHVYTESYSLTETIEKYRFLRLIDRLGRGD